MKYKLIICLLILNLQNTFAGNTDTNNTEKSMFVTISGSSTINQFQLTSNKVNISQNYFTQNKEHYFIEIPVFSFHGGIKKITSDFRQLVKAKSHPTISIVINPDELIFNGENNATKHVNGTIKLAGETHQTQIEYSSSPTTHNKVEIKGKATLNLTHFNLEPPKKLFGALKVHDRIFVNFVFNIQTL